MEVIGRQGLRKCYLCSTRIGRGVNKHLSMHKFPSAENMRFIWKQICDLKDYDDVKGVRLCSKHFQPDDYATNKKLKTGAVPTIKVPCPVVHVNHISEDDLDIVDGNNIIIVNGQGQHQISGLTTEVFNEDVAGISHASVEISCTKIRMGKGTPLEQLSQQELIKKLRNANTKLKLRARKVRSLQQTIRRQKNEMEQLKDLLITLKDSNIISREAKQII